jgi:uncharacterized membrane protein YhaH (DUF805 family)
MHRILRLWFGLTEPVSRGTYLFHGALLMGIKYSADTALVHTVTGRQWTPWDYVNPLFSAKSGPLEPAPSWLWVALALWSLPFLWIGVSMTLRRALDAGLSPWACLIFFLPVLNWILMASLAISPSRPVRSREQVESTTRMRAALQGVAAGVGIGLISFALQILLVKSYSASVFLGTPFTMGAAAGYFYNRGRDKPRSAALGVLTVFIGLLATLLFAFEGLLCVSMAAPLALPLGALGAKVGEAIARERRASHPAALALFVLLAPISGALDRRTSSPPMREVLSSVEIDASPERIWPHLVSFTEIEAPPRWFFRLGIAYPIRARIEGHGPGAVRRCEFSTGSFVEPITAWEEPARLAFEVASQPPPLHEWSPYRQVHAQHLLGTLRSRRGEFRLVPLSSGRTRLEGRTWYQLSMEPQAYWVFFSDLLIHAIHRRVLAHIAEEFSAARAPAAR